MRKGNNVTCIDKNVKEKMCEEQGIKSRTYQGHLRKSEKIQDFP